ASWPEKLTEVEYRLGLKDQAGEHCAIALAAYKGARQEALLGRIFPGRADTAAQWWRFLRAEQSWWLPRSDAGEDPVETMKRLRDVLEGRMKGQAIDDLVKALKRHPEFQSMSLGRRAIA